ncbi:glycosyltransferase [Paenibacillus rubinfantis]|uniref:glycosyltransferase n=1 Tax=Paenibacillus rubinfantis TaxID=1720296 RepID=UPI00073F7B61|nr:glycosyltransferase [Paenibacillus rubinfantis]
MNENKIAFITCSTDKILYEECLRYIKALNVPEMIEVEIINITDAEYLSVGYNRALKQSDAKFKVYIDEKTLIINKDFIFDTINLFKLNPRIGAIGVIGSKTLPTNCRWEISPETYGCILHNSNKSNMELLSFNPIEKEFELVRVLDGLLMVTQYDIPWIEDKYRNKDIYSISQSVSYSEEGYLLATPKQENPWCIYDDELIHEFDRDSINFILDKYRSLFPLVSILIPTYNRPNFFLQALESVINQSYKNIEIIVCDDSTNNDTEQAIIPYLLQFENIKYYKNEKNLGQFENDLKCLDLSKGDFINFLMDDDLFHPLKIEKMMDYLIRDKDQNIKLVTSHRQLINSEGDYLEDWAATERLFEEDTVIDGISLGEFLLKNIVNSIGEPTTVLFRKNTLIERFGYFANRKYVCNVDLASWMGILHQGNAVYISESLSFFRIHNGQQLQNRKMLINGRIDFCNLLLNATKFGYFKDKAEYLMALENMWHFLNDIEKRVGYVTFDDEYDDLISIKKVLQDEIFTIRTNNQYVHKTENHQLDNNNAFAFLPEFECYVRKDITNIDYADGSEDYIINIFKELKHIREDSQNLLPFINSWGSKYHLSPARHNLFDFIKELLLEKKGPLLELGGGMGAITWWLAQNFKEVDVIEGSLKRAHANVLRNKEFSNVKVYVDNLLNMSFPREKYDIATLIGVLEYIPFYAKSTNPQQTCVELLKEVGDHLEDDGILVVAIENKLGAKYFSGCAEDHNNQLFSGISGYPESSAITFSRKELTEVLKNAGYENIQFYHCFPDYKFPSTIIKESENMYDWNYGGVMRGLFPSNGQHREYLMPDALLIDSLSSAQLLHEFSNSFLVLCSKSTSVNLKTKVSMTKYSNRDEVKPIYHHKVNFLFDDNGYKKVERTPLSSVSKSIISDRHTFELRNEPYIEGKSLTLEAYRHLLRRDNYNELVFLIKEVRRHLLNDFSTGKLDPNKFYYVKGESIDYSYNNLIRDKEGRVRFVDRKWIYCDNITEDYVIFRNLNSLFQEMHPYITFSKASDFILFIIKQLYSNFDENRLYQHYQMESIFQNSVNRKNEGIVNLSSTAKQKSFVNKMGLN